MAVQVRKKRSLQVPWGHVPKSRCQRLNIGWKMTIMEWKTLSSNIFGSRIWFFMTIRGQFLFFNRLGSSRQTSHGHTAFGSAADRWVVFFRGPSGIESVWTQLVVSCYNVVSNHHAAKYCVNSVWYEPFHNLLIFPLCSHYIPKYCIYVPFDL